MANFKVILDSNIIFSITKSNLLMWVSQEGIYQPQWSEKIESEVLIAVERQMGKEALEGVNSRLESMRSSVEEPIITGYEFLIDSIDLSTDPDDRHIVAAACHAGAELIVTQNLKDLPDDELEPYGIRAISVDDFMMDLIDLDKEAVLRSLINCRENYKNPKKTVEEFLDLLKRNKFDKFVAKLESLKGE